MSKSSKSSGSGDEKNLYLKRLKTANAPPKVADVNLTVKQSEIPRSAPAKSKRASTALSKQQLKSKIPSPANTKGASITQSSIMISTQSSNRGEKRVPSPAIFTTAKSPAPKDQDMPEVIVIGQSKATKKDGAKAKINNDETDSKDKDKKIEESEQPVLSTNGTPTEPIIVPEELTVEYNEKETTESVVIKTAVTPEVAEDSVKQAKTTESETGDNKELDEEKDSEFKLQVDLPILEIEEIVVVEERELTVEVKKKVEDTLPETNVVESTTSDASPVKEPPQPQKDLPVDQAQNEGSFISYDSNIMLKDVKIKLNDCLRDNSKAIDAVDPNASISESFKDRSFGRTLRGISGRSSLGRMKNITVREQKSSPNDSLFVNISSMSYDLDRSRFTPEGSPCHNGSRLDRKRKIIAEHSASTKKAKIEEGSNFLNTSLEYLRGLRKPVQVSTPNHGYKFDLGNKMSVDEQAVAAEEVEPKKWCVVM